MHSTYTIPVHECGFTSPLAQVNESSQASFEIEEQEADRRQAQEDISALLARLMRVARSVRKSTASARDSKIAKHYQRISKQFDSGSSELDDYMVYASWRIRQDFPQADEGIITRVLNAIRRRNQVLLYQSEHRQRLNLTHVTEIKPLTSEYVGKIEKIEKSTNEDERVVSEANDRTDTGTVTTLSVPDIHIFKASFALDSPTVRTVARTKSIVQNRRLDFPKPPRQKGVVEFECPYCCCILGADTASDILWRSGHTSNERDSECG